MTTLSDRVKQLEKDAASGTLGGASRIDLEKYLAVLCEPNAYREFSDRQFPVLSETVRTLLLRVHIETLQDHVTELHNHITKLNKSNAKIQRWVIALASAALIAAVVQTTVAIRGELREGAKTQQGTPQPQQSAPPSAAPVQVAPQSSGQSTKKKPES